MQHAQEDQGKMTCARVHTQRRAHSRTYKIADLLALSVSPQHAAMQQAKEDQDRVDAEVAARRSAVAGMHQSAKDHMRHVTQLSAKVKI